MRDMDRMYCGVSCEFVCEVGFSKAVIRFPQYHEDKDDYDPLMLIVDRESLDKADPSTELQARVNELRDSKRALQAHVDQLINQAELEAGKLERLIGEGIETPPHMIEGAVLVGCFKSFIQHLKGELPWAVIEYKRDELTVTEVKVERAGKSEDYKKGEIVSVDAVFGLCLAHKYPIHSLHESKREAEIALKIQERKLLEEKLAALDESIES